MQLLSRKQPIKKEIQSSKVGKEEKLGQHTTYKES